MIRFYLYFSLTDDADAYILNNIVSIVISITYYLLSMIDCKTIIS